MGASPSRRRFVFGAAGAAASAALAGCGVAGAAAPDELVVHTQLGGTTPGAGVFASVVRDFRRRNPHISVKLLTNGDDLAQVYETSRLAGKEADIAMVNLFDKTLRWTDVKATVPVNRYLDDWGLRERVTPAALADWTDPHGRLRAFPYFGSNWPVAFNRDLLHRVGADTPPTTVDGLLKLAKPLRAQGRSAVAIGGSDWTGQKLFTQIIQAYVPADEARHLFTTGDFAGSSRAMRGIELFAELRDAGVFPTSAQGLSSDSMNTAFNTGKAAAESTMSSALAQVPAPAAARTVIGGFPIPGDGIQKRPTIMRVNTVAALWISPNGTKKLPLVEKFVRFLYSPAVVARFVTEAGRDMALHTGATSTRFPLVAKAQALTDRDVSAVVLPDLSIPGAAQTAFVQATGTAYTAGSSPRRIAAALTAAYRSA